MLIKEYRIPLPFTLDEYHRGQLYAVAESSKDETGGGEGVEVLEQTEFESSDVRPGHQISGIYTKKIYRFHSKAPYIFRKLLPQEAFVLHEESWNAYPYTKTVLTNPDYMREKFQITIESIHCENDRGQQENDMEEKNDVHAFRSEKTGRGPLNSGWTRRQRPIMCAYKLVTVYFKWWGLQSRVEKAIHKTYPRLFVKLNREVFCWMDRWLDMTMEDIHEYERTTMEQLKRQLRDGSRRGMRGDDSGEKEVPA
ncbi:Protein Y71G12B.17 [Aphelenchoides avenae]|nr:Protein Y71G12B.17 [Aphelenchus avenae]